ncbi:MAG: hypothetical protein ACI8PZ_005656 [Myxococcota bacterium]
MRGRSARWLGEQIAGTAAETAVFRGTWGETARFASVSLPESTATRENRAPRRATCAVVAAGPSGAAVNGKAAELAELDLPCAKGECLFLAADGTVTTDAVVGVLRAAQAKRAQVQVLRLPSGGDLDEHTLLGTWGLTLSVRGPGDASAGAPPTKTGKAESQVSQGKAESRVSKSKAESRVSKGRPTDLSREEIQRRLREASGMLGLIGAGSVQPDLLIVHVDTDGVRLQLGDGPWTELAIADRGAMQAAFAEAKAELPKVTSVDLVAAADVPLSTPVVVAEAAAESEGGKAQFPYAALSLAE